MGKDEDRLARALLTGTLQVRLQQINYILRVGSRARRRAVGVVAIAAELADGDEGIALYDLVDVIRIRLAPR